MTLTATETRTPQALAATFTGILWAAIRASDGPRPSEPRYHHIPAAYHPDWLAALPLPTLDSGPPTQQVALIRPGEYDRYLNGDALKQAHEARPRSRSFENVQRSCNWLSLVSQHLQRLSASELEVLVSLYESDHGDENLGPHWDVWYSAIVHLTGAKVWTLGHGVMDGTGPTRTLTTTAGDILLIPQGLAHDVSTPADPGHSRHLQFTLCRPPTLDGPLETTLLP
ncbi:MAG TPA: cupin domain-containing protein [Actinocrinis sp.]|nr:cupin domain-containing protein [Actinocrinis sp.]